MSIPVSNVNVTPRAVYPGTREQPATAYELPAWSALEDFGTACGFGGRSGRLTEYRVMVELVALWCSRLVERRRRTGRRIVLNVRKDIAEERACDNVGLFLR